MLLTIDCGNTNIVFALHRGETQLASWRTVSDSRKTVDELVSWLYPLMQLEGYQPSDVTGAILASVVPAARRALEGLCQKLFGLLPLVVGTEAVRLGVPVRVDRPEQVGADRLVNAVAAYARFGGDLVVIDFGTATTFDVIARDGAYEGGVIAPGINLSMEALHNASALLPRITVQQPERVIGKATIPAMESGVFWGYIGMIEGMISRIQAEYGAEMTVIATGGLAPLFERATEVIDHLDSDLTLRGLRMIYELNVNKRNIDGRNRGK